MRTRFWRFGAWVFLILALAGCATPRQEPLPLAGNWWTSPKPGRIGVAMTELPKVDTQFPGASCLLCIGVANMAHTAMNKEVQSFSTAELKPLVGELVSLLNKRGLSAVAIDEPLKTSAFPELRAGDAPNKARRDFSALKAKHGIERLLVVDLTALGVWRSYSAYVPTDVPRAVFYGSASIIDLSTQNLEWFLPLTLSRAADGAWDEPPKFPGLSNAYYQLLESGMDQIKKPFLP